MSRHGVNSCKYCGGDIIFRWVDDYIACIHLDGERCPERDRSPTGPSVADGRGATLPADPPQTPLARVMPRESFAYPTRCPKCNACVFYWRRHAGSSMVADSLLTWPNPAHECYGQSVPKEVDIRLAGRGRDDAIVEMFRETPSLGSPQKGEDGIEAMFLGHHPLLEVVGAEIDHALLPMLTLDGTHRLSVLVLKSDLMRLNAIGVARIEVSWVRRGSTWVCFARRIGSLEPANIPSIEIATPTQLPSKLLWTFRSVRRAT